MIVMKKTKARTAIRNAAASRGMGNRLFFGVSCLIALSLTGCAEGAHYTTQSKLCVFSNDTQAKACTSGELAFFSPDSWGNSQLPLNVIGAYCNTNRPIEFNKAGVICTFTTARSWLLRSAFGKNR